MKTSTMLNASVKLKPRVFWVQNSPQGMLSVSGLRARTRGAERRGGSADRIQIKKSPVPGAPPLE